MARLFLISTIFIFLISCTNTRPDLVKFNKYKDPDTGVETTESIISFYDDVKPALISFNQTKNPKSINWYIICKFYTETKEDLVEMDLIVDEKHHIINMEGGFNTYEVNTKNTGFFGRVDYYKINEKIISDLYSCKKLDLYLKGKTENVEFKFNEEQCEAVKDWISKITIPK